MMARLRPLGVSHIMTDGHSLYTPNLVPGVAVYGERLVREGGVEYRAWNPRRSKLAALLLKGWTILPLRRTSEVLYLGAATGTTVSHLSDLCSEGMVYAVEVSRRAFQGLVALAEKRHNLLPILADAGRPDAYAQTVTSVDLLYQDIAQRDQVPIFAKNLRFLDPDGAAILMVKARSIDVARKPSGIYREVRTQLERAGLHVLAAVPLEPFQADHAAVIAEPTESQ